MMLMTIVVVVAVLGFATNAPSVLTENIFLKMTYFLENIFRKLTLKMSKKTFFLIGHMETINIACIRARGWQMVLFGFVRACMAQMMLG